MKFNNVARTVCLTVALGVVCFTGVATADEIRPGVFRTPDERFENLPGFNFEPHYVEVVGLRMHYLDEGPGDADPILLLHGEPTWSYLYRKMIPVLTAAGHRIIAPDLIGFGRSDKPAKQEDHTYKMHVDSIAELLEAIELENITLVCQDWGSLIGLRVAAENPDRFDRIVLANGGLPTGDGQVSPAFAAWRNTAANFAKQGDFPIEMMAAQMGSAEIGAAYAAPFPDKRYEAGPLIMPLLVPISPDDPASEANRAAWDVFRKWEKPFLTAFSDGDPITRGGDAVFRESVPGAKGQPHTTIKDAGHFLQEAQGEAFAKVVVDFIAGTPK